MIILWKRKFLFYYAKVLRARAGANELAARPHGNVQEKRSRGSTELPQRGPRVRFRPFLLAPFLPPSRFLPFFFTFHSTPNSEINSQKKNESSPPFPEQIPPSLLRDQIYSAIISRPSPPFRPPSLPARRQVRSDSPSRLVIAALIRVLTRVLGD